MTATNRAPAPDDVPPALLDAAQQAARELGRDVAEVPLVEIAKRAGISRSTLLRRLGGTRSALDEALRAAGIDPGGQQPVRERAVEAGAHLISRLGLASATLESVAAEAGCSVYSLYSTFGGRTGLLQAVFERFRPTLPIDADTDLGDDPVAVMTEVYLRIADAWTREPRVLPAMLAEVLANPHDPTIAELVEYIVPRSPVMEVLDWIEGQVAAGRLRDLPRLLLLQQLMGPLLIHVLLRPHAARATGIALPDLERTCAIFAENFVRAVVIRPDGR
ncbi:TetR/AcrR family transcriptional regulator [Rhodococcus sp. C26F]